MPSQIKVDEIKNVAGQYKIKTNIFEGQTTAGSITVQGEGTATTNLQQGLNKVWFTLGMDAVQDDSFNCSSVDDDGTGDFGIHFTNAFNNARASSSVFAVVTNEISRPLICVTSSYEISGKISCSFKPRL